jgi:hypothetical protein
MNSTKRPVIPSWKRIEGTRNPYACCMKSGETGFS